MLLYSRSANGTNPYNNAGYSVHSSPHLAGALELDDALLSLSANLSSLGLPTKLSSSSDLDAIMSHIEHTLLPSLKLYEFYALDVAGLKAAFRDAWASPAVNKNAVAPPQGKDDLSSLSVEDRALKFAQLCLPETWAQLGQRYHAKLDLPASIAFVAQHLGIKPGQETANQAADEVAKLLDVLNVDRYREYDGDVKAILDNTRNRVKYARLDEHGPKRGEINATCVLAGLPSTESPADLLNRGPGLRSSSRSLRASRKIRRRRHTTRRFSRSPTTGGSGTPTRCSTLPPPSRAPTSAAT